MGENNSVHQEHINSLSNYLLNIGIKYDIINKLRAYNFGLINGIQVDAETYKKRKSSDIVAIKMSLNDFYIKINLMIRFLFKGSETQFYDTDAINPWYSRKFFVGYKKRNNEIFAHISRRRRHKRKSRTFISSMPKSQFKK